MSSYRKNSYKKEKEVDGMELTPKKIEQLKNQPIIETQTTKSEDGRWILHRTTILDIKPVSYMEKVLE
jgi:hypothetical protein